MDIVEEFRQKLEGKQTIFRGQLVIDLVEEAERLKIALSKAAKQRDHEMLRMAAVITAAEALPGTVIDPGNAYSLAFQRVTEMRERIAAMQSPALRSVLLERERQEKLWGEQNHDPFTYLTILTEEVGETAQAALQTKYGGKHGGLDRIREEAVQTAAVALAIVECLDRKKWTWPEVKP